VTTGRVTRREHEVELEAPSVQDRSLFRELERHALALEASCAHCGVSRDSARRLGLST
jgi:hypothetical protein